MISKILVTSTFIFLFVSIINIGSQPFNLYLLAKRHIPFLYVLLTHTIHNSLFMTSYHSHNVMQYNIWTVSVMSIGKRIQMPWWNGKITRVQFLHYIWTEHCNWKGSRWWVFMAYFKYWYDTKRSFHFGLAGWQAGWQRYRRHIECHNLQTTTTTLSYLSHLSCLDLLAEWIVQMFIW